MKVRDPIIADIPVAHYECPECHHVWEPEFFFWACADGTGEPAWICGQCLDISHGVWPDTSEQPNLEEWLGRDVPI